MDNDKLDYCRVLFYLNQIIDDLICFKVNISDLKKQYMNKINRLDFSGLSVMSMNRIKSDDFYPKTINDIEKLVQNIDIAILKLRDKSIKYENLCRKQRSFGNE